MSSFVEQAIKCFGLSYDTPEIAALLAPMPEHKFDKKPNDGCQYAISKVGGYDLLFENINIHGGKQNRVLQCIYLYSDKVDKHKAFTGALPFGLQWSDKRSDIVAKHPPSRTWVIGEGRVAMDANFPDGKKYDDWVTTSFNLHLVYHDDGRIYRMQIHPHKELDIATEWKKPVTWQDLALQPSEKMAAITMYKTEHKVSTIEAKQAVETFIAAQ